MSVAVPVTAPVAAIARRDLLVLLKLSGVYLLCVLAGVVAGALT